MKQTDKRSIENLLEIMARLRDPEQGCPWDRAQDFRSIAPYTIEEAYEVADAIDRNALPELRDELGDLLLQVVFHARMASEIRAFDFGDVVEAICDKMLRRHPHVFGGEPAGDPGVQRAAWESQKADERQQRGGDPSAIAGIGMALPALMRAEKLGKRAARVGFDWPDLSGVLAKLEEETHELAHARDAGDPAGIHEELGDLLFTCVSLARHLGVDPEQSLRDANRKFERRFRSMERAVAASGRGWREFALEELEDLWRQAKEIG